jgi:hypothetical protein
MSNVDLDWRLIREVRLLVEKLTGARFWAFWFLLLLLSIAVLLQTLGGPLLLGRGGHP